MKKFKSFIICILICLVPTLMAGQALQVQQQLLPIQVEPQHSFLNSMQQTTDTSLLRLSALGPLHNMGISIELNSLDLSSPGPTLFLDCPDPLSAPLGAIRFQPSDTGSHLRISNIGSSGQDGVSIDLGVQDPLPFRPGIHLVRPTILGPQSAIVLKPGEETSRMIILNHDSTGNDGLSILIPPPNVVQPFFLSRYDFPTLSHSLTIADSHFVFGLGHHFDTLTPLFSSRISHSDPLFADSFFDISYDLSLRQRREASHHMFHSRLFQPSLLQLRDRVATDSAGVDSFFDVFYDISTGEIRRSFGTPTSELQLALEFEKSTPKLGRKIFSTNPLFIDSFFDIDYNLSTGHRHEAFNHLHHSRLFHPSLLQLRDRVATDSAGVDSFFDVFYDISTGEVRRAHGTPVSELRLLRTYDQATPRLVHRVQSTASLYVDSFFDIEYNISTQHRQEAFNHLHHTRLFHPSLLQLRDRVATDSAGVDSFFDVFYDISTGEVRRAHGTPVSELRLLRTYDQATPRLVHRVQSTAPLYVDSFFDIEYNLSTQTRREAFGDLHHTRLFQPSSLQLRDRVGTDLAGVDSFFDVFYDITTGDLRRSFGTPAAELQLLTTFDPITPRLVQRVQSTNPLFVDSFFDVTFDLSIGHRELTYRDLQITDEFLIDIPRVTRRVESTNPAFADRYIEKSVEIQTELIPLELTSAGFPGLGPIEVRTEYDGLSRVIREEAVDTDNGAVLLLERQLSLTGSTLLVGGSLLLDGGVLFSTTPLTLIGPAIVEGDLQVNGEFSSFNKFFKIDHPLDPENKYLYHSCVESPDMMNVYNGNVITDEKGYATVFLPDYFEALNVDFRYQLTCIGEFAQAIIDEKINDNKFIIRTDKPAVEVSWQVTGVRNDPAAKRQQYVVEAEKEPEMKGTRMLK